MIALVPLLRVVAQLAAVARAPIDTAQGVNFHALVVPDTVFVGEQATYEVGVFIEDQLRLRLRRNPEFVPPEPRGMLTYDLPVSTHAPMTRRVGDRTYEVHVFQRALFPLTAGRYTIPPAQLAYSLPLSLSFFSREEGHTLLAESVAVVAVPPPVTGRPADYAGAVGDLHIDAHLDSAQARVGNPMMLTVRVAGRGDMKLLPRPALAVPWASSVAAQERVRLDSATDEVQGEKAFDWLVTPRDSGIVALPPVRYPYFNPYTDRYAIAVTPPETLRVAPGALIPADTMRAAQPPPLPVRTVYRGALPPPFYSGPLFLALLVAAPVPALAVAGWRRPRRRRAPPSAAARLRVLAKRRQPADPLLVRRLFVRALADRFHLPVTALTDPGGLARALRREGVTTESCEDAEAVLSTLDRAAFGAAPGTRRPVPPSVSVRAREAYAAVAAEARRLRGGVVRRGAIRLTLVGAATIGTVCALRPVFGADVRADAREFHAGLAAYGRRNFSGAARRFAAAAMLAPGAPDAWANAGTAAWALGDTADAVVGWQRAGRLEPWAGDIRERLALVRAPQDGPMASLPRVPVSSTANAALMAWLAACAAAAWRLARRRAAVSLVTIAVTALALSLATLAIRAEESATARNLSVVTAGAALYAAPALAADRVSALDAGDIARTLVHKGVWSYITLDNDREGWVETTKLTSIVAIGRLSR